jgi:hypothetical protein
MTTHVSRIPHFLKSLGSVPEVTEVSAGEVLLTSGRVVNCDPLVELGRRPFDRGVPPGRHRAFIGQRARKNVYARLDFGRTPTTWELAIVSRPGTGHVATKYTVDAGFGAFVDAGVAAATEAKNVAQQPSPLPPEYVDPVLQALREGGIGTRSFANVALLGDANIVAFESGPGNGSYESFFGLDDAGEVAALVTVFVDLDPPKAETAAEPATATPPEPEAGPTPSRRPRGSRFLPALDRPVRPKERYHVVPRIGPSRAEEKILSAIREGLFRPGDAAEAATIEEAYALYVPFWRIDLSRSDTGTHFANVRIGSIGVPIPHQQTRETAGVWMVSARSAFPYAMKNPGALLAGEVPGLAVSLAALEASDPDTAGGWEVLDADVDQDHAITIANAALSPGAQRFAGLSLLHESDKRVDALHFVRYPIWFARYRYRGEASKGDEEGLFYLGISAVDGKPITAEHPSKFRAAAAKVKRFFGLDE